MADQQQNKTSNTTSGIFLIIIGVIGIATRFITDHTWTTVTIVKFSISVAAVLFGLWTVLRKK